MRTFTDQAGREWTAYSVNPSDTDRRMSLLDERWAGLDRRMHVALGSHLSQQYQFGWITFECGEEKRRLLGIPEGWEQLNALDLFALCERARPSLKRDR